MKIKQEKIKTNNIIALCIVSAMDVFKVKPDFTYDWTETNKGDFYELLHQFGMDINSIIDTQEDVTHKDRTGRLVTCHRYVGSERYDKAWIESGYASREAKDKASGSSLLNDIYRSKGLSA